MSSDIIQPLPLDKWPLLAESLKKKWPSYCHYYIFVQTAIRWISKEPNLPIMIYCPDADYMSGIFIGISSFAAYQVVLFAHEGFEELLEKAVLETKLLKWSERVYFPAIQDRLIPIVHSIVENLKATKGMKLSWSIPGSCSFKSKEECVAVEIQIPEGYYLNNIDESHVPIIHSVWPHRDEKRPELTTKHIQTIVRLNGGLGLFSKENNQLLSWALQSDLGALSNVQTIDRYKRNGFAKIVVNAFAKELALKGIDSFVFIVEGNRTSEIMFKSLNWKRIYFHDWLQLIELKDSE